MYHEKVIAMAASEAVFMTRELLSKLSHNLTGSEL